MITGSRLLTDIDDAQNKHQCVLRHSTIESLIGEVGSNYRRGVNFKNILDAAVNARTPNENEQHAYKYVLGKIFARRRHKKAVA